MSSPTVIDPAVKVNPYLDSVKGLPEAKLLQAYRSISQLPDPTEALISFFSQLGSDGSTEFLGSYTSSLNAALGDVEGTIRQLNSTFANMDGGSLLFWVNKASSCSSDVKRTLKLLNIPYFQEFSDSIGTIVNMSSSITGFNAGSISGVVSPIRKGLDKYIPAGILQEINQVHTKLNKITSTNLPQESFSFSGILEDIVGAASHGFNLSTDSFQQLLDQQKSTLTNTLLSTLKEKTKLLDALAPVTGQIQVGVKNYSTNIEGFTTIVDLLGNKLQTKPINNSVLSGVPLSSTRPKSLGK